jgi:Zn-finger nucleic acid-binding protein
MIVVEWARVELDHCPRCGGTWFDAGELDLLLGGGMTGRGASGGEKSGAESPGVESAIWALAGAGGGSESAGDAAVGASGRAGAGAGAERTATRRARCPRCARRMRARTVTGSPGVEIDVCPEGDGIWFDRDEAAALARALAQSGGAQAAIVAVHLSELFRPAGESAGKHETLDAPEG